MDDFLLFGSNKKELWLMLLQIEAFLTEKLRLRIHPKKRAVYPVSKGIDWVGYMVFPDCVKVRRRNIFRFRARNQKLRALFRRRLIHLPDIKQSIMSFCAYSSYADANMLTRNLLEREIF